MRLIGLAVVLALGLVLAPLAADALQAGYGLLSVRAPVPRERPLISATGAG